MSQKRQQNPNKKELIETLSETIFPSRIGTYLNSTSHNPAHALELYIWNARLGESFHVLIQAVEISLRNRIVKTIIQLYGEIWWKSEAFSLVIDQRAKRDIHSLVKRLQNKDMRPDGGQIVAGLSFGFWVALLHRKYNPSIWSKHLNSTFPHLAKGVDRQSL